MDAQQVQARLEAIEAERRQLQREQEQKGDNENEPTTGADPGASSTTRRALWALARELMQEPPPEQQEDGQVQEGDDDLPTLREALRLLEGVTAAAALPSPSKLLAAADGDLAFRLPALVEQHLAARAYLEALLEAEQRGRCGVNTSSTAPQTPTQQLLGALLRLVRGQGRALRERCLWAVRHQVLSFPSTTNASSPVACVHRRPRPSGGLATAGLLPLLLALERLQAAAASNPLPLTVTEDPRERRRAASPRSPRGAASSLGPPPTQLDRLLAGVAHALVDRAVLPALGVAPAAVMRLKTGPHPGLEGEVVSLILGEQQQQGGDALATAVAAAEAVAGFVCEGLLDGEPWWAEDGAHRPLLAPLVDPLVEALGEAVAEGLLRARPQDDEAARALLRPLLPVHGGQQQATAQRSLALQRLLERVAVRALAGPTVSPATAAVASTGPFNVREAHARALALGRSQELLAGLVSQGLPPPKPKKGSEHEPQQLTEAEAAALRAWRDVLREACAAPSPAVAPPAVLACIPKEIAALAAAVGHNPNSAAGEQQGLSPGRRQQQEGEGGASLLSPGLREGLAEAFLAYGHRQGRAQQQLQGGVGGREWSQVDVALKLRPAVPH